MQGKKVEQSASSLRSRLLGARLRTLREERGLTLKYVAAYLGVEFSALKWLELGEGRSQRSDVVGLLDLYGVHDVSVREFLMRLARDAYQLSAWEGGFDSPQLDVSMLDFLWLESVADGIRCYGTVLVPDLLRTSAYAEATVLRECGPQVSESEQRWWVRAYTRRQREVFERRPAIAVQVLVGEAALHRPVGAGERARRAQLEHLAKAGNGKSAQVRVLPTAASYVPGMDGSFAVFDLPRTYGPAVACLPCRNGVAVHEGSAGQWYADAFDRLWEAALPAAESVRLITDLVSDLATAR